MKNTIKILGIIALAAVIGFSMTGCKRDDRGAVSDTASPAISAAETTAPAVIGVEGYAAEFLAEYEIFINEYVSIMQRILAGDFTVIDQAETLEARAEEMANRFDNLSEDDLTPALLQRYLELTEKMTNAFGF